MSKIKLCEKCLKDDTKVIIEHIKSIDKEASISTTCHNMCGISRLKKVAIINNRPLIKDTTQELIKAIEEEI